MHQGFDKYDVSELSSYIKSSSSLEHVALETPKPALILQQGQEFAAAVQNAEDLYQIFKISPDLNIKCERQEDF
ncbi:Cell division cycle-associated protein 2 [Plecturocebus cupreus]